MSQKRLLLLPLALAFTLGGCGTLLRSACDNSVKSEKRSPDGKYVVTLFERNCGATTDFSTIVNLRESSEKLNGDDLGILVVKGQHEIDLTWDGNTGLRLQCSDCRSDDIFKQERKWKDVQISLGR
jgi:hypothetical protein